MKHLLKMSPHHFIHHVLVHRPSNAATKSKKASKSIKSTNLHFHLILLLLLVMMEKMPSSLAAQSCLSTYPNRCHWQTRDCQNFAQFNLFPRSPYDQVPRIFLLSSFEVFQKDIYIKPWKYGRFWKNSEELCKDWKSIRWSKHALVLTKPQLRDFQSLPSTYSTTVRHRSHTTLLDHPDTTLFFARPMNQSIFVWKTWHITFTFCQEF